MSSLVKMLSLFALAVAIVVPQQTVSAKDPVARVRMTASIAGVKAVAKYEERGARRKFNFQLELATPGATGTVSAVAADGAVVPMGSFTVNALGRGIIDIDTTEGDFVADLNAGSVITLVYKSNSYTGTLRLTGAVNQN